MLLFTAKKVNIYLESGKVIMVNLLSKNYYMFIFCIEK